MTTKEILESLCYYDKRNPNRLLDDEDIEEHKLSMESKRIGIGYNQNCSCDNCFYGRTKLAEELLKIFTTNKL